MLAALLSALLSAGVAADDDLPAAVTDDGHYRVVLFSLVGPPPLNEFHDWEVRVETASGEPLDPHQLAVYGGMPGHGHGLPSSPRVAERLSEGRYRVEGMRFNMAGDWELFVGVNGPAGPDKARFDVAVGPGLAPSSGGDHRLGFSATDIARMRSLALPAPPVADPGNRLLGNADAIALGRALFSDSRLGAGNITCATCHVPALAFSDGRRVSIGIEPLARNAPGLLGAAGADWYYWDGRRDSLWAQALTPIETRGEMGGTRTAVARLLLGDPDYRTRYARLAGRALPDISRWPSNAGPFGDTEARTAWQRLTPAARRDVDRVFSDAGKAIAAYVATLEYPPTRFDAFVAALDGGDVRAAKALLDADERAGLKLFLDAQKTKCLRCHNGPRLTSFGFHNIGTATDADGRSDFGRAIGIRAARHDPFNCTGDYSDAPASACTHHRFDDAGHPPVGAFKVPSLRELTRTAPYMHDGRFSTLDAVVAHYRAAAPAADGSDDLFRLEISDAEAQQLTRFLRALSSE